MQSVNAMRNVKEVPALWLQQTSVPPRYAALAVTVFLGMRWVGALVSVRKCLLERFVIRYQRCALVGFVYEVFAVNFWVITKSVTHQRNAGVKHARYLPPTPLPATFVALKEGRRLMAGLPRQFAQSAQLVRTANSRIGCVHQGLVKMNIVRSPFTF